MREIDPETNCFRKEGYRDGLAGLRAVVPDEARHLFQWSDYFAGYYAGREDRADKLEDEKGMST